MVILFSISFALPSAHSEQLGCIAERLGPSLLPVEHPGLSRLTSLCHTYDDTFLALKSKLSLPYTAALPLHRRRAPACIRASSDGRFTPCCETETRLCKSERACWRAQCGLGGRACLCGGRGQSGVPRSVHLLFITSFTYGLEVAGDFNRAHAVPSCERCLATIKQQVLLSSAMHVAQIRCAATPGS